MHGLADLTAPYQHGISLARALTEAGVLFRYQVRTYLKVDVSLKTSTSCAELRRRGSRTSERPGTRVQLDAKLLRRVP
jgi:hypothetical protein